MNEETRNKKIEMMLEFLDGMPLDDAVSGLTALLVTIIENVDLNTKLKIMEFVVGAMGETVFGPVEIGDIGHVLDKKELH